MKQSGTGGLVAGASGADGVVVQKRMQARLQAVLPDAAGRRAAALLDSYHACQEEFGANVAIKALLVSSCRR